MRYGVTILAGVVLIGLLTGCLAPRAQTPTAKREAIETMRQETLAELYQRRPAARTNVERAEGYAVFSNVSAQIIYLGGGGGYGVVVDRLTGRKTYMKMAQVDLGLGLGVQDLRVIFVFHTRQALDRFVTSGWDFGVQGDLAAKAENRGGAASGEVSVSPEVDVYTLTESGLMAKVNLAGTKYWQDRELNQ